MSTYAATPAIWRTRNGSFMLRLWAALRGLPGYCGAPRRPQHAVAALATLRNSGDASSEVSLMRRVVLLCVAADAASGGRPGEDHLPPMFLIPSLCGSRIRAWSTIDCASPGIKITPGADLWVAPALIAAAPRCWSECMRLWGPNMTDM